MMAALALLADARLPSGGHTQSAGLEPAVLGGLDARAVPDFIEARLRTTILVDAAAAVLARAAGLGLGSAGPASGAAPDGHADAGAAIDLVWREWAARTPSHVVRQAAERAGRGYCRLIDRLWGSRPAALAARRAGQLAAVRRQDSGRAYLPKPLALGVGAACIGLDSKATATLVAYDDVATVASACLKLLPGDPADSTAWICRALPRIEQLAEDLAQLDDPAAMPTAGTPQLDEWVSAHSRRRERLFSA